MSREGQFERAGVAFERKAIGLCSDLEDGIDESSDGIVECDKAQKQQDAIFWEDDEPKKKKKYRKDADGNDVRSRSHPNATSCSIWKKRDGLPLRRTSKQHSESCRQLHPDKAAQNGLDVEKAHERFKQVQEAYEILIDPVQRQMFDSIMPAKYDRIPSGEEEGDFFEIFGPAFERYSRWSEVKPCP